MKFDKSIEHYRETLGYIPMGTSTFSRNPNLYVIGAAPLYISHAKGCRVYDLDGNEYIDYSMGLSIVLLGYGHDEVNQAAKEGIDEGLLFTLSCPEELALAKRITEIVPCAEMVRFVKSGSDSCEGAIRLARNYTGKLKVVTVGGYHGFHDWFMASTPRRKGIPEVMSEWVLPHQYNDMAGIERTIRDRAGEIAAVIMEPIINYEPNAGYLERIRDLTESHGIVLIFDEMKTGFRLDMGGGQNYFHVIPDIAIFGKALANGFPLSALVGKKEYMRQFEDENCFLSASYATEKASLKASLKVLEIMERDRVLEHVWDTGERLKRGIEKLLKDHALDPVIRIVGLAPMTHFIFSDLGNISASMFRSYIQQECVKRGVLFVGYNHTSWAHRQEDIDLTLKVYDEVFALVRDGIRKNSLKDRLEGKEISSFGVRR